MPYTDWINLVEKTIPKDTFGEGTMMFIKQN